MGESTRKETRRSNRRADIYPVKRALESNARLLKNLEFRLGNLTLTAPVDGVVLPPPEKKEDPKVDGHLPSWHGSLLRKENNGARVEMDDVVCLVGDPGAFEAMLVIDQSDIPFVQEDLEAMIRLDSYAGETLSGKITDIAGSGYGSGITYAVQSDRWSDGIGDRRGWRATPTKCFLRGTRSAVRYAGRPKYRDARPGKNKGKTANILNRGWRLLIRTFHFNI